MTKKDLILKIATDIEMSKKDVEEVINSFIEVSSQVLKDNGKIQLPGFGTLEVTTRAARTGRNIHTKEVIEIAASKSVKFKPGKSLKTLINE